MLCGFEAIRVEGRGGGEGGLGLPFNLLDLVFWGLGGSRVSSERSCESPMESQ